MSVTKTRVTRSKRLCDVTNRSVRPSSRSPQRTDFDSTAVMKRTIAHDIPGKRIKIESSESINEEPEEPTPAYRFERSLKMVLAEAYCDFSARLKLPTSPKCVFNLKNCIENHVHKGVSFERHFLERELSDESSTNAIFIVYSVEHRASGRWTEFEEFSEQWKPNVVLAHGEYANSAE